MMSESTVILLIYIAHNHCIGDVFHEHTICRLRHVAEISNTEQNVLKLPHHRQKLSNTDIVRPPFFKALLTFFVTVSAELIIR